LYFPPTLAEFKEILDSGNIIRFMDELDVLHIYGKEETAVRKETNNTLNAVCDWNPKVEF
jgi:hypothetical protein